ncbi:MAG: pseudouridine synthase [Proteobacteria bacterium]|nr:pseudouridine synthase [Pseudomonadota bacterium]MBS0574152.1 pseudouridine synthase [Pseudomonadota bacterium]
MTSDTTEGDRIAKVMARAGVASRRDAERMIVEGRVAVNGTVVTSPALDVAPTDRVTLDGKPIDAPQPARLWLYYKPLGLVTSERDEKGRQTVFETLPEGMPRVMSVGRLDLNSEGLLLLTNDGGIKRRLELPSTGWLRKYRVRVNGRPSDATFDPLRRGVTIEGEEFLPMDISLDRQQGANAWLTVGLREGRNREIRRAMAEVGLTVNRLIRVSYGPFRLNEMKPGDVTEVKAKVLREQLGEGPGAGATERRPRPARDAEGTRGRPRPARGDGEGFAGRPRARSGEGEGQDRKPRPPRGEGYERKPRAPRGEGYERKPRAPRSEGEGFKGKPRAQRAEAGGYDRKPRAPRGDGEGFAGKPRTPRAEGAGHDRKPRPPRSGDEQGPARGPRPARTEGGGFERKPRAPRSGDDQRPSRNLRAPRGEDAGYERKPRAPRSGDDQRPSRGPRPARTEGGGFERKPRAPRSGEEPRPSRGPRPARTEGGGFERKPRAPRAGDRPPPSGKGRTPGTGPKPRAPGGKGGGGKGGGGRGGKG